MPRLFLSLELVQKQTISFKEKKKAGDKEVLPQNEINDYCKVEPRHEESFGFAKFI